MTTSAEFEGAAITQYDGRIPAIKVECPEPYKRGTILKLSVEVRVKSVRLEENKDGDLTRSHIFAVETINVDEAYDPHAVPVVLSGSREHTIAEDFVEAPQDQLPIEPLDQTPGQSFLTDDGELALVPSSVDERLTELEEIGF